MIISACDDKLQIWNQKKEKIPVPSANTIAFMDYDFTLCITNNDYSDYYRLTYHVAFEHDWSPDKQWLCFMNDFKLWKIKYDGSEKVQLTPSSLSSEIPRFSPKGDKILFSARNLNQPNSTENVYIMDTNGKNIKKITNNSLISYSQQYHFGWADWFGSDNKIIFKYAKVENDIMKIERHLGILDLTSFSLITLNSLDSLQPFQPRRSPTRDEIVFVSLVSREFGGTDLYRANPDGSNIIRLTNNKRSWLPDWSADGERIIYTFTKEDGIEIIRTMSRDGTVDRQITIPGVKYTSAANW